MLKLIKRETPNKLDDLMIRGREKIRSKMYTYFVGSNRTISRGGTGVAADAGVVAVLINAEMVIDMIKSSI